MIDLRHRLLRFVLGLMVTWLSLSLSRGRTPPRAQDWPRYGHDAALTSRSTLRGNLTQPARAWSYSVAGNEWRVEVTPTAGAEAMTVQADDHSQKPQPGTVAWPAPPTLDLDGTGLLRPLRETYHERWAKLLPNVPGWQRVAWNQTWTDQQVCRLQLFAYDHGFDQPRLIWQSDPPEATIFQPLNIVADIDRDGVPEICVAAHYRVMIFEGTTGRKETELRYHQSRPYGWFGLADLDADGRTELVTLGDFQSHVDVLDYDPAKPEPERLSVRWRRDIEQNIDERRKWPQIGPHPVLDLTGDHQPEIVLNLFNDTGDGQWHTTVLRAADGQTTRDFPQRFLQGAADVDQDGASELFLTRTDGLFVPAFGAIELVKVRPDSADLLWSRSEAASWAVADLPRMESNWSTTASQGMRQVLVTPGRTNQRPIFLSVERSSNSEAPWVHSIKALRIGTNGQATTVWQVSGWTGELEPMALAEVEPDGAAALIRLRTATAGAVSLLSTNAKVQVTDHHALGIPVAPPIAACLRPRGGTTVVVEGAAQHLFAIEPPRTNHGTPKLLWHRPGRGMSDGSRRTGLLAADLDGDGGQEIIAADPDCAGLARLVAYGPDGTTLWRHGFAQTPGAPPVWNIGGLTFWWAGRFRFTNQVDLFVNTRRGLMHSDVGWLLDGRSGQVVWRQDKAVLAGQFSWGYAGTPPGIADLDGDGLDELLCLYPVCFWVADGRTGRLRHGVDLAGRKALPAWAAYGEPIIHNFTGQGRLEILLDSPYILALLDTAGTPLWHGPGRIDYPTSPSEGNAGQTTQIKHALADLDGNGTPEIVSGGYGDGVRAMDAARGRVLWSLQAPNPTCPRVTAADVDDRKGEELLYVASNRLIVITGDRTTGRVLWEWEGPGELSMPVIADVDEDGLAEVVLVSADGQVHCLDGPR